MCLLQLALTDVRFWHLADNAAAPTCPLLGQSGQSWILARDGLSAFDPKWTRERHLAERLFYHPCLAARLGGVSGGKETQGWRDSSHTAMVGAGKFGSAKLPMATAMYPGKPSPSQ